MFTHYGMRYSSLFKRIIVVVGTLFAQIGSFLQWFINPLIRVLARQILVLGEIYVKCYENWNNDNNWSFNTDSSLILQLLRLEYWVFRLKMNLSATCRWKWKSAGLAGSPLPDVARTLPPITMPNFQKRHPKGQVHICTLCQCENRPPPEPYIHHVLLV